MAKAREGPDAMELREEALASRVLGVGHRNLLEPQGPKLAAVYLQKLASLLTVHEAHPVMLREPS